MSWKWMLIAVAIGAAAQTIEQAQQMEAHGDWKGAASAWSALAQQSPKDYRLWTSLGVALAHEQRYDEAVAAYRKALALHPQAPQTELDLGLAYFKAGKLPEALEPLRLAAQEMPDSAQAQILLGMSLYGTRHFREAAVYLEQAVSRSDGNAQLRSVLAQCYLNAAEYEKARAEFEQMLRRDPDSPGVHILLGEAYDGLNRRDQAIAEFRAAVSAKEYTPMAHFGLGYLLWADKQYEEAGKEFRSELQHDPKNGQAMAYLADIELKKGDRAAAEQLLREAVELDTKLRIAHFDLGVLASDQRHYTAAIDEFKQAVAIDPTEPDAHYRLAHIFQQLGRKGEAQEQLGIVKQLHEKTRGDLIEKMAAPQQKQNAP